MEKAKIRFNRAICKGYFKCAEVLSSKRGSPLVEYGVLVGLACAVGGLVLAGIYALFKTNVLTTLGTKVTNLFSYTA